jgi:hypothetical protein
MTEKDKQPRYFVLCVSFMIAVSAYVFSVFTGVPHIFFISAGILLCSNIIPYRIKYNDRSVIYGLVISLSLAVIFDLIFPIDKNKFMLLGERMYINISAPFFIYFSALLTFLEFNRHIPGLVSAVSIIVLVMTADVARGGDTEQTLPLFAFSAKTQGTVFVSAILAQLFSLLLVISFGKPMHLAKLQWKKLPLKYALILTACVFSGLLMFFSVSFYNLMETRLRILENYMLRHGFTRFLRPGTNYLAREANIGKAMMPESKEKRDEIVLRALSEQSPGYLRGRVFASYNTGIWQAATNLTPIKMNSKSYEGILAYKTFYFGEREENYPVKQDFLFAGNFNSNVLLVPGNYAKLELVAERLICSGDGILTPEEWERDGAYTVFAKTAEEETAFSPAFSTSSEESPEYLSVPSPLDSFLDEQLSKIFHPAEDFSGISDEKKMAIIAKYFSDNFKYSLDFAPNGRDIDPLETFFAIKRGHCELFASSAALLARRMGMPSRYVTGFLCFEPHPAKKYFISRAGNAHAWAEVYLRDKKKWVLLETTPADGFYQSSPDNWNFFRTYYDMLVKTLSLGLADVRRGFFAKAVLEILAFIYEVVKYVFWHPFRAPLILAVPFLIYFLRSSIASRKRRLKWQVEAAVTRLTEEFYSFEKKISHLSGIKRDPALTIQEWSGQILPKCRKYVEPIGNFLREYQKIRFNPASPSKTQIAKIAKMRGELPWKDIKKEIKRGSGSPGQD